MSMSEIYKYVKFASEEASEFLNVPKLKFNVRFGDESDLEDLCKNNLEGVERSGLGDTLAYFFPKEDSNNIVLLSEVISYDILCHEVAHGYYFRNNPYIEHYISKENEGMDVDFSDEESLLEYLIYAEEQLNSRFEVTNSNETFAHAYQNHILRKQGVITPDSKNIIEYSFKCKDSKGSCPFVDFLYSINQKEGWVTEDFLNCFNGGDKRSSVRYVNSLATRNYRIAGISGIRVYNKPDVEPEVNWNIKKFRGGEIIHFEKKHLNGDIEEGNEKVKKIFLENPKETYKRNIEDVHKDKKELEESYFKKADYRDNILRKIFYFINEF